jgi:hypothetical protein
MSRFVSLTRASNGKRVLVNSENITYITTIDRGTIIHFNTTEANSTVDVVVSESLDDIGSRLGFS